MEDIFILDHGAASFRAGRSVDFPSDGEPRVIVQSHVTVKPPAPSENQPANLPDASALVGLQKIYDVNGTIQNWEGYESIIYHILYEQLGWPPGDEGFLIATDNLGNSRQDREKIVQLMFETFNVMGYYMVDSAVSALYAMGKTQGIVVDVGHSGTDISQVLDGALVPAMSQRFRLGGAYLDRHLQHLLSQRGVAVTLDQAQHVKEQVAKIHDTSDAFSAHPRGHPPQSTSVTLPDGQKVSIAGEGYSLGESLILPAMLPSDLHPPNERLLGLAEAAYACVMQQTEPVLRRIQFENMLVCGGCSNISGLAQRFIKEVKHLMMPSVMPALILAPEYMPERVTHYAAFMGAGILSKCINPTTHYMSKADYEEFGPSIVNRKC